MEYNSPEFRKWLDKLQQESWQLELIISGFAIYGLIMAIDPLSIELTSPREFSATGLAVQTMWLVAFLAVVILIFNLVIHVILRGLWIGAIGLRYVSGDIDFDKLNYSEKFNRFLKNRVGSFDKYISNLENYCSLIFALTFLLVFYIIAYFLVSLFMVITLFLIRETDILPDNIAKIIGRIFIIIFSFFSLIVFIDFIGQGFLKKKKWTSKLYFPIYRVFNYLTISFLYRPLAYNFLDNKFARRLSIMIVPFYIGIIFLFSFYNRESNYLKYEQTSSENYINKNHYDDLMIEEDAFVHDISIPSKVITSNYLKIFIVYHNEIEDYIFEKNDSLHPNQDRRGFASAIIDEFKNSEDEDKIETLSNEYLKTFNSLYTIEIDSIVCKSDFIVSTNQKNSLGFETYVQIGNLENGKHNLNIRGPKKENRFDKEEKTKEKTLFTIPFWYFPENSSTPTKYQFVESDSLTSK